jgi:oligopeptide transport system substrate-binding protein
VGYRGADGLSHDANRAIEELAAAGWRQTEIRGQRSVVSDQQHPKPARANQLTNDRGEEFPIVELLYTSGSARYRWMSLTLAAQWEQALGVTVQLRAVDTKFYKDDLKQGKFMIARGRWYGDYGDPTTFLDINRTGDGNNDRGYSSEQFDAIMESAAAERDPDRRMRLLQDAERLLVEQDLPLAPICQLVQVTMFDPDRVRGISTHPRFIQYLWELEIEESPGTD